MLLILALFALQVGEPLLVNDEIVTVPPSELRSIDVSLHQRPAILECRFHVAGDHPGVRAILMTSTDAERFRNGKAHAILASTDYRSEGQLRVPISALGDYAIVVDNRLEGRRSAQVRLKVSLVFYPEPAVAARFATKERQGIAIAFSFLFFLSIAVVTGWKIRAALNEKNNRQRPPLYF